MRPQPNATAKELRSILATLLIIRILNCVAKTSMNTADLVERLCRNGAATDGSSLNRTLLKLRRQGWLTARNSNWSPTPKGRKALKVAILALKESAQLGS